MQHLVYWLGKFPFGLLVAAVAELLLVVTGHPGLEAATRCCVRSGSIAAAAAGGASWASG